MKHQNRSLLMLTLIFFAAGFLFCMNDILLSSHITQFKLNFIHAPIIQFTFYLKWFEYKISLLLAVVTNALGISVLFARQNI